MTIDFSPNWNHYSWSNSPSPSVTAEEERDIITQMIHRCSDSDVRRYANARASEGIGVYVRTGIHKSPSDNKLHVQVVLGSTDPDSWKIKGASRGHTVHIYYRDHTSSLTTGFPAAVWRGQPHLRKRGTDARDRSLGVNHQPPKQQRQQRLQKRTAPDPTNTTPTPPNVSNTSTSIGTT